jgi:hypothetical protein
MKKFTSSDLGGAPITKSDLRVIFNEEIWVAIESLLAQFNNDTQGIVVSGCVTTANVGNFDITEGVVFLNGQFMLLAAATNQAFTKHIVPASPVNDTRAFADATSHIVAIDQGAELSGSVPGAGQYITISSLTDLDDRRWKPALLQDLAAEASTRSTNDLLRLLKAGDTMSGALVSSSTGEFQAGVRTQGSGVYFKMTTIQIGDWDMDATPQVLVPHGIADFKKIRAISVLIRNDADSIIRNLTPSYGAGGGIDDGAGPTTIDSTNVTIDRASGGFFDSAAFDSTGFNRGWVTITYEA